MQVYSRRNRKKVMFQISKICLQWKSCGYQEIDILIGLLIGERLMNIEQHICEKLFLEILGIPSVFWIWISALELFCDFFVNILPVKSRRNPNSDICHLIAWVPTCRFQIYESCKEICPKSARIPVFYGAS